MDFCFSGMDEIRNKIESYPDKYTAWFKIAFPKLEAYLASGH
jgi:isopentenyl-diphosphate delta-isomerase